MEIYTFANMYEYFFILMYICLIKRSDIKVISFKLPSTTDVNQKVYNATDLTNYFILGWCVHKMDQVSSIWIWNPEHVSQLYIDSDGVFVTVISSYVFGQECKVVLHRI